MKSASALLVTMTSAVMLLGASGCAPPHSSLSQRLAFHVSSDPGKVLSGARLLHDGKLVATSDATGAAPFVLEGHDGETFDFTVECPAGFQSPAQPTSVVLRRLAASDVIAEYDVSCTPKTRAVVVAVKGSRGHRLPVMHLGQEVARTDTTGVATVLLHVGPQEQFDLALDTSAQEDTGLRPQSPAATFSVKNSDEVLTFDPHFSELPKPVIATPRPRRAGPQRLPIRIQ